jgi:concanavalin A-like lectin/glucanase superfamily protein
MAKRTPGITRNFGPEFGQVQRKKLVSTSEASNTGMHSTLPIPGMPTDNLTLSFWVRLTGSQAFNTLWASKAGEVQVFTGGAGTYDIRSRHYNNKAVIGTVFGQNTWAHICIHHGLDFDGGVDLRQYTDGANPVTISDGTLGTDVQATATQWLMGDDATTTTDDGFIGELFDFCVFDGIIPLQDLNFKGGKWVDLSDKAKDACVYRIDGQASDPGHDSSGKNHHFTVESSGVTLSATGLPPGANEKHFDPVAYLPAAATGAITGSGAISTSVTTLVGTGEVENTASGAIATTVATLSGTGKMGRSGSGAINAPVSTLSGTGELTKTGSGAINTTVATLSGTGEVSATGSGAISATVAALSGTGKITVTGSGTPSVPVTTLSGTAEITKTGTGALSTTLPALSGTGTVGNIITGSGVINTTIAALSATGEITVTGSGAINAQLPALSGTGVIGRSGSGAISTTVANLNGSGPAAAVQDSFGGGWWQWVPKKKKKERKPEPEIFEEIKEAIAEAPAGPDKKAAAADLRALRRAIKTAVIADYQRQLGELATSLARLDSLLSMELRRAFLQRRQKQWDDDAAILLLMAV